MAYKLAMEAAEKELKRKMTKEEALHELIDAGILDKKGNFTAPYSNLARVVKKDRR